VVLPTPPLSAPTTITAGAVVIDALKLVGNNLKERTLQSSPSRWVWTGTWCPAKGCRDGGRERQPDFHVMDLIDCITERHPWCKTE